MKIKTWTNGVVFEDSARQQIENIASLPIIHSHVAVMPDVHAGIGATVGSVIPTKKAIIPAAVGVDIGCGMVAVQTNLTAKDLPESLSSIRLDIEKAIPVGQNDHKKNKTFSGHSQEEAKWLEVLATSGQADHFKNGIKRASTQLGTLGGGNHFVELCLDESQRVWAMLHSGSRGIGNLLGRHYIDKAKELAEKYLIPLPDKNLAYFAHGTFEFDEYWSALNWAQKYASLNREKMLSILLSVLKSHFPHLQVEEHAINCHHNYAALENHFGENVYVTRKGAVRARKGDLGIIPGSMGAKSYIVEGLGNPDSFHSCSHGAGRVMSRGKAKEMISIEDHQKATEGVECRKDSGVLDESPAAYKDIDAVMEAQKDLVKIRHTLKQILCVKG